MGVPQSRLYCADEGGKCNFGGTKNVWYQGDKNGQSVNKLTNSIPCNNDAFGSDPDRGNSKTCWLEATLNDENNPNDPSINGGWWNFCAKEGGDCNVGPNTRVAFGLPGRWVYATKTGQFHCGIDRDFGSDPAPGLRKACYTGAGSAPNQAQPIGVPSTGPTPAPTPAPYTPPSQPAPTRTPEPAPVYQPAPAAPQPSYSSQPSQPPVTQTYTPPAAAPAPPAQGSNMPMIMLIVGIFFILLVIIGIVFAMSGGEKPRRRYGPPPEYYAPPPTQA